MNAASTVIDVVLIALGSAFLTGALGAAGVAAPDLAGVAIPPGVGVPVRLVSVLTVKSLPWVSMMAVGNSANLVSRAVRNLVFASLYKASTGLLDAVLRLQLYYHIV